MDGNSSNFALPNFWATTSVSKKGVKICFVGVKSSLSPRGLVKHPNLRCPIAQRITDE